MADGADYHSDEPVDIKPAIKKRKKRNTMPPPSDRDQAPRRSGRKRQQTVTPFDLVDVDSERFQEAMGGKKRRKTVQPIIYQDSDERITSPELMSPPHSAPQKQRKHSNAVANDVQAAFDTLEQQMRAEKETHAGRQAQEIEKLKKQLKERKKDRTGTDPDAERLLAKKDQALHRKDKEIKELAKRLKDVSSYHAVSKMALDTRDKELTELRLKHNLLVKVANNTVDSYDGMGLLADAVHDATK